MGRILQTAKNGSKTCSGNNSVAVGFTSCAHSCLPWEFHKGTSLPLFPHLQRCRKENSTWEEETRLPGNAEVHLGDSIIQPSPKLVSLFLLPQSCSEGGNLFALFCLNLILSPNSLSSHSFQRFANCELIPYLMRITLFGEGKSFENTRLLLLSSLPLSQVKSKATIVHVHGGNLLYFTF